MVCEEEKTGNACGFSGERKSPVYDQEEEAAADCFFEKLGMLNESSGLSLVFNFRETLLDLHLLYKEVIKRGGFYEVTEAGKWGEVATTLNPKSLMSMSQSQLQKVYEILILQYEQMYCKMPEEANKRRDKSSLDPPVSKVSPSCSTGKRKHCDCSSPSTQIYSGDPDELKEKKKISSGDTNCQVAAGSKTMDQNSIMNDQESRKDPDAPLKPRTGYQIFLKLECHRLKMIHGESSGSQNIRDMAIQAWKFLPEKDKKPYIDASKLDKERYDREMSSYMQRASNQNTKSQCLFSNSTPKMLSFSTSLKKDDKDYRVSLQTKHESFGTPDESMVELAIEEMKNADSNDWKFRMHWDN